MIYVKVQDGVVVNSAVFGGTMPVDWPEYSAWHKSDKAQIGWKFTGGKFVAPGSNPQQPLPPLPFRIAKNSIWERATDAEAVAMKQALSSQSVRVQEIYNGATHISTDHELFALLNGALTGLFGAVRANQLLAPTD